MLAVDLICGFEILPYANDITRTDMVHHTREAVGGWKWCHWGK